MACATLDAHCQTKSTSFSDLSIKRSHELFLASIRGLLVEYVCKHLWKLARASRAIRLTIWCNIQHGPAPTREINILSNHPQARQLVVQVGRFHASMVAACPVEGQTRCLARITDPMNAKCVGNGYILYSFVRDDTRKISLVFVNLQHSVVESTSLFGEERCVAISLDT